MSNENNQTESWTCDSFEEIVMEMVEPSESEARFTPHSSMAKINDEEKMLATLQDVLDDLLADRAFWESSPRTTFDAFGRLKEKLKERINASHTVPASLNGIAAPLAPTIEQA